MAPRATFLALAVLLVGLALTAVPAMGQVPLVPTLTGPSSLAPKEVAVYNLTLAGGPTGTVSYTVQWYVTGPGASGAVPSQASPTTETRNTTAFRLNVTAPSGEASVTLVVKASAQLGTTYENSTVEKAISIITPIVLSGTFRNDGTTAAVNITVRFYVDDGLVGSKKIARIDSHATTTATFNYLPVGLQPGTHRIRIEADLDGNGVIDPSRGEVVLTDLFYKSTPSLGTGWTVLIGIAVFFPVFLGTVALRRRQRT